MSLTSANVDINPQYADSIDVELFKVQILFSEGYEQQQDETAGACKRNGKWTQLPRYSRLGIEAFQEGLEEVGLIPSILVQHSTHLFTSALQASPSHPGANSHCGSDRKSVV